MQLQVENKKIYPKRRNKRKYGITSGMNYSILESQLMNFEFEVFRSNSLISLLMSKNIFQIRVFSQNLNELHEENITSQDKLMDISIFLGRQKVLILLNLNKSK